MIEPITKCPAAVALGRMNRDKPKTMTAAAILQRARAGKASGKARTLRARERAKRQTEATEA